MINQSKHNKVLTQINMIPVRESYTINKSSLDMKRKIRNDKMDSKLEKIVAKFKLYKKNICII